MEEVAIIFRLSSVAVKPKGTSSATFDVRSGKEAVSSSESSKE